MPAKIIRIDFAAKVAPRWGSSKRASLTSSRKSPGRLCPGCPVSLMTSQSINASFRRIDRRVLTKTSFVGTIHWYCEDRAGRRSAVVAPQSSSSNSLLSNLSERSIPTKTGSESILFCGNAPQIQGGWDEDGVAVGNLDGRHCVALFISGAAPPARNATSRTAFLLGTLTYRGRHHRHCYGTFSVCSGAAKQTSPPAPRFGICVCHSSPAIGVCRGALVARHGNFFFAVHDGCRHHNLFRQFAAPRRLWCRRNLY